MSYRDTFKKFLKENNEPEDNTDLVEDGLDEESTSGGAGGYDTPNAFGELPDDKIEMYGYKKVAKKKVDTVKESEFKRLSTQLFSLSEISYPVYKKEPGLSPKQKVNTSINEMHRKLREIERIVNHNVRLKQEAGVDNSQYWKSSRENLSKISERLLRVSTQLKELAA